MHDHQQLPFQDQVKIESFQENRNVIEGPNCDYGDKIAKNVAVSPSFAIYTPPMSRVL
jgi:hypothetical protein